MTLTRRKIYPAALGLLLAAAPAFAIDARALAEAEIVRVQQALQTAQALSPQGAADEALRRSQELLLAAEDAMQRRRWRDATGLAQQAQAWAELSSARTRLLRARDAVEQRNARNADLRREAVR
jgi:hypothetical protein